MRLDRSLTLHLFRPLRSIGLRARGCHLPILMYHSISDAPEPAFSPYYQVCTSPNRFAEHMQGLAESGWQGVSLSDGLDILAGKKPISAQPVAITFDDGFQDFYTAAFPILQRHGFSATMYLPTAFIGDERRSFKSRACLQWDEIKEMRPAGIEFGSHTVHHPVLHELSWIEIETELRDSKSAIEDKLQQPVPAFAYPYAFPQADTGFVKRFCGLLSRLGYLNSVTTTVGRARPTDNWLQLPRLPANSLDDRAFLEAKLSGAYDWMAVPQLIRKKIGRRSAKTS
ncbi:MAG: polysaccharide deacetylase family protein [Opitutaceae bacterium]|jgi:peptidoglycan/xylan/chitin deacetylase (PgdA/CDA1 family)